MALAGRAVVPEIGKMPADDSGGGPDGIKAATAMPVRRFTTGGRTSQLSPFSALPKLRCRARRALKRAGKEVTGDQQELYLLEEQPGKEGPYERLLADAMAGNGALFTREDAVEAAWAVIDSVLKTHHPVRPYKRGSWGPKEANELIETDGGWHNPVMLQA